MVSKPYNTVAGVFMFDVFDHYPVFAVFKNYFEQVNLKVTIDYRVISDDTLAIFSHNLSKVDLTELLTGLDLNASVGELDSLFLKKYK